MRKISLNKFVRDTFKELKDLPLMVTKRGEPYVFVVTSEEEEKQRRKPKK